MGHEIVCCVLGFTCSGMQVALVSLSLKQYGFPWDVPDFDAEM